MNKENYQSILDDSGSDTIARDLAAILIFSFVLSLSLVVGFFLFL